MVATEQYVVIASGRFPSSSCSLRCRAANFGGACLILDDLFGIKSINDVVDSGGIGRRMSILVEYDSMTRPIRFDIEQSLNFYRRKVADKKIRAPRSAGRSQGRDC